LGHHDRNVSSIYCSNTILEEWIKPMVYQSGVPSSELWVSGFNDVSSKFE
jgi:hypothetical protein